MRLFAALYPSSRALDAVQAALETLRGPAFDQVALWTPVDLWHVTTSFYAGAPPGAVDDLVAELRDVALDATPMELHLRGAGVFHDRVLWLGVGGDTGGLRDLSHRCAEAGERTGLPLDRRPRQRAHLTVARARQAARAKPSRRGRRGHEPSAAGTALGRYAEALSVYVGPAWTADELCLVESDPTATRPVHRVVERFELGGPLAP